MNGPAGAGTLVLQEEPTMSEIPQPLPRQLVVLCDGTNNNITGGKSDTNVLKLMDLLEQDAGQHVFYDPGVGNASALPGATWMDRARRRLDRLSGLAFGQGAYENIAEAYIFLMRRYRPGDQIFIFGFSRGAFTARAVAGMVNQFGLLRPELENMVATLVHVYFSDAEGDARQQAHLDKVASDIRRLCTPGDSVQHEVYFVGVWDTVSSIGLPPFSREIQRPPTVSGKRMRHVRQALALDEHRRPFRPRLYAENNFDLPNKHGQTLKQEWFAGAHSDVGGGHGEGEDRLADEALHWLVEEARSLHLRARPLPVPQAQPLVHCESQANPWWAAAGLCVREMRRVRVGDDWRTLTPVRSRSGTAGLRFPQDTAWRRPLGVQPLWALAALALFYLLMGTAVLGRAPWEGSGWLRDLFQAQSAFAGWHLWPAGLPAAAWPRTAVLLDFGLIAAYSYLLGTAVSRAFAWIAGLRDTGSQARPVLDALGLGLMGLVAADVAENAAVLLLLLGDGWWYAWLGFVARIAVFLAAWTKFGGLAMVLLLLAWGLLVRATRPAKPGTPGSAPAGA
jgi:uncharacterized protein (DUF2235 family)